MEVRPIDANALFDALYDNEFQTFCPLDEVSDVIDAAPTLDYEPVRHGEWVEDWREDDRIAVRSGFPIVRKFGYKCSLCGRKEKTRYEYCHCGAKMDGGK